MATAPPDGDPQSRPSRCPTHLSFEGLLGQLRLTHDRELLELRSEVKRLQELERVWERDDSKQASDFDPGAPQESAQGSRPLTPEQSVDQPRQQEGGEVREPDSAEAPAAQMTSAASDVNRAIAAHLRGQASSQTDRTAMLTKFAAQSGHCIVTAPSKVVGSRSFADSAKAFARGPMDLIVGAVIVLNVCFVYLQLEFVGYAAGAYIGAEVGGELANLDTVFSVVGNVFAVFFAIELCFKIFVLRSETFYARGHVQKFNIFDMLIVLLSILDLWVLTPMQASLNVQVIRLMRFIRIFRALRVVRTFEVFSKLRVLVQTVIASFFALFWSMVLLTIIMIMTALLLCQALNLPLIDTDSGIEDDTKMWVYRYYGTPSRSLWSVFELTFSGGWPNYARPLVEEVNAGYAAFFAVYIAGVTFAMFRIITALFLKDTLTVASADMEEMIHEKMRDKAAFAQKLLDFFMAADISGDGYLTVEEFDAILQDERVKAYLSILELDTFQTRQLFEMLDDGDQKVSMEEFVKGALRLKGQARSRDVVAMMHDFNKLSKKIDAMHTELQPALTQFSI